ncbi:MAG: hypothetical protein L3K15_01210 [Thermoplasmata archaeon]|nr:hypothetical protein [Thermoplasmata archaeon]
MARAAPPRVRYDTAIRLTEIFGGLASVVVSVIVLANPLLSPRTLTLLLAAALAFDVVRVLVSEGIRSTWWRRVQADLRSTVHWLGRLGPIGLSLVAAGIIVAVLANPAFAQTTLLYLLAFGVVVLSIERMLRALGRDAPVWLRSASAGTGVLALLLVGLAIAIPSVGLATFAILIATSLLLGGVQSVVTGLRPTDVRQIVLLKLVLFSLFYGLVLINWIDLFGKSVPGYGVWLILTYFAPFWVLIVYEGYSEWPLALSLGLLVSLANDIGYYFVGNLLFGFQYDLVSRTAGQLGFQGNNLVTVFQAGPVAIPVDSWEMGLSIYLRAAIVSAGLYYWWRHPSRIVARIEGAPHSAPSR